MWGTADKISLEFNYLYDGYWSVIIPPDLDDGWYAAVLYAQNKNGRIGTWNGLLFVSNGYSCLRLNQELFTIWLEPQREVILLKECEYHEA